MQALDQGRELAQGGAADFESLGWGLFGGFRSLCRLGRGQLIADESPSQDKAPRPPTASGKRRDRAGPDGQQPTKQALSGWSRR